MSISERIAVVLQMIVKEGQADFSFLIMYKSVPFTTPAAIHSFGEEHIWFRVETPGLVCALPSSSVFLLSDGLLDPIEAQVDEFIPSENLVRLSGFTFAGMRFAHRRDLRVEPEPSPSCRVENSAGSLEGTIIDLTMRGVGVHLAQPLPDASAGFDRSVVVSFGLPEGHVRLQGQVRRLSRLPATTRISIEFTGNEPEKSLVVRYLLQRRRQIVDEANQISEQFQHKN